MKTRSTLGTAVLMTVVIGVLLLVLLAEGCSTTPSSPAASGTLTTSTKPYGSLTIQAGFSRGGLADPHMSGDASSFNSFGSAIFDSLIELTPEGKVRPGIAERWEIASDGKTHTFYIRKGVKFHDGSDLTGADVKFSIERLLDPKSINAYAAAARQSIASLDLIDSYTVALRMKSPQFDWLSGFENLGGTAAVVPKKYIEEKGVDYFGKYPVGSGPWKVLSYAPGVRVELEAFESHWRVVPQFKNITLLGIDEEASKVAMLKTGELDLASVAADSVPGLKSAGLRIINFRGGSQYVLYLFHDLSQPAQYKVGDVRVRKALSLAINRQELTDKILSGNGSPEAVFHVPPSAAFFDPNVLKPDPYDPEGAKKLLTEAGYPNGFSLKFFTEGVLNTDVLNQAVAGYWNKLGVKAEMVTKDRSAIQSMWTPKLVPEVYDTAVGMVTSSNGFEFEKMISYHSTKTSMNNIKNLRLDELIDKVAQTAPSEEKKKLQLEAVLLGKNEYAFLPILHVNTIMALGSKVGGFTPVAGLSNPAYSFATIARAK